jgi:hypothetical protein
VPDALKQNAALATSVPGGCMVDLQHEPARIFRPAPVASPVWRLLAKISFHFCIAGY